MLNDIVLKKDLGDVANIYISYCFVELLSVPPHLGLCAVKIPRLLWKICT